MSGAFHLAGRRGGFAVDAAVRWEAPVLALLGPSGAGKSTLVEAILGLWPARGPVEIGGRRLDGLPPERRRLGWVPQSGWLFPHRTVRENLAFGAASDAEVEAALSRLELRSLAARYPHEISGGEARRVALGRALAAAPAALLLDEPFAGLDRRLRVRILEDLSRLRAEGVPMVLVSHDLHEVFALADEVALVEGGRILRHGPVREVLASPQHGLVLGAGGVENVFAGHIEGGAAGEVPDAAGLGAGRAWAEHESEAEASVEPAAGDATGPSGALVRFVTEAGTVLLACRLPGARGDRIAVRAEEIVVTTQGGIESSAQNVLSGTVRGSREISGQVLLEVEVDGAPWQVAVTHRAVRRLGLSPGRPVTLWVKATSLTVL
ncbi:MAG: ATP-binding cassette domain-containing protein [Deltaproteobacteria bacterium]|nr:MAG: ATP-binding cassette domain-containing protein [Deltaproteobacteria bacterium]